MSEIRDGYTLRRARPNDTDAITSLIFRVHDAMPDPSLCSIASVTPEWVRGIINERGFVVCAEKDGVLVSILVVIHPGLTAENLGYDAGFSEAELKKVIVMDISVVASEHRGHHLERRMLLFAEQELRNEPYTHYLCTVSPDNAPSLRTVQSLGYQVLLTKEKYGGLTRHVLLKEKY